LNEITPAELATWRNEKKKFMLLDVRNGDEVAAASLPESTHIPMHEVPQRVSELPTDQPIAVLCHHGGRSERVAGFLAAHGFEAVNVDGGIDAYARTVDTNIPRY
jgi:rhodanese-related sulfurtransferase